RVEDPQDGRGGRLRRAYQPDDRRRPDPRPPRRGLRHRRGGADHPRRARQLSTFDEEGNCIGSNFTDYLLPTSWETPTFETYETVTPSPHHPIGAKGVGESATVGSPAAY